MKKTAENNAKAQNLPTGELLVREGYITQEDLDRALDMMKKEKRQIEMPFESILIQKQFLNPSQLKMIKGHPDLRKKIGRMVVEHETIEAEKVKDVLRTKSKRSKLGKALVEKKLISPDVLDELLEKQKEALTIGELAVRLQMMREIDLVRAFSYKHSGRAIGEILIDNGAIRPEDLSSALKKHNKRKEIGEILIQHGMIDKKQFQTATTEMGKSKDRIGIFLVKKGLITFHQLYHALSLQYNIPYMELVDFAYDQIQKNNLIKFVAEKYARRNVLLPLTLEGKDLLIGIAYPEGLEAIEELRQIYRNLNMDAAFINEEKFQTLYASLYDKNFQIETDDQNNLEKHTGNVNLFSYQKLSAAERNQPTSIYSGTETEIKKVVDYIINYGVSVGASDIHIEQDRKGVKLRYRIDGICQDPAVPWLKEKMTTKPEAIISRIKVMSNLDISERRIPQDGVFRATYEEGEKKFDLDFRVATCPAIIGENITIRILDSRKTGLGLDTLNHSRFVLDPLKRLIKSPAGMILVTGPTGSGKSSTLYAALKYINGPELKIITAEDPIEYSFPGIMQTQVNSKIDLTFSRLLRSFLRLDPDVILVGEIRDQETAAIGFDAAQTGHLLLSTLHTIDSVSAVTRLLDLGIDHNQIASNLIGVLSQRLVRRTCSKCSRPFTPPKTEWRLFFRQFPEHITFYRGIGCKACDFTGYSGRTLISELLDINQDMTLAISCMKKEQELRKIAIKAGMKTMADDGIMKMNQIALSELIRVLPLDMIKEFKSRH